MNEQERAHFEDLIIKAVQETAEKMQRQNEENSFKSLQAGKEETSNLVGEIKDDHKLILTKVESIERHLGTLNGSVAKHNDKLANHDIINAQTTLVLSQLTKNYEQVSVITVDTEKFRNQAEGSLITFKWLFGFLGVGNVIMFLKVVLGIF